MSAKLIKDVADCLASGWSLEDTAEELELEIEQVEVLARTVELELARQGRIEEARRITALREEVTR